VLAARLVITGYPFDVSIAPDGSAWVTRLHAACSSAAAAALASTGVIRVGIAPTRVIVAPSASARGDNQFTKDVAVVDLAWRRRIGSIAMEGDPLGAVLSPDARTLYVTTNLRSPVRLRAHRQRRADRAIHRLAAGVHRAGDPSRGQPPLCPTWKAGHILELDARSLSVTHRYDVGGQPLGVALSTDGLRLYCGNEHGWLDLVHLPTGKIVRRAFDTPVDEVALTPDQSVVYASLRTAGQVAMADAHTLACVGTLEPGGLPGTSHSDRAGTVAIVANEAGWVDLVR